MAYQEGDTSPPHINVHNEVVTQVQDLADARNVDVILPPQRNIGDTEHVKDHNLITDALAAVAAADGGKVLQVVRATDDAMRQTNSTSYEDVEGMSVTITPTKSTSTVLVITTFNYESLWTTGSDGRSYFQITDSNNTVIDSMNDMVHGTSNLTGTGTISVLASATMFALDSSATDVAKTYKLQFKSQTTNIETRTRNDLSRGQMYAIELADVVVSP